MKNILIVLLLASAPIFAQTYIDKPFAQDFADKFKLHDNLINTDLQQVECDRNGVVKIISSNGILQAFEKQLLPDLQYSTLTDMHPGKSII